MKQFIYTYKYPILLSGKNTNTGKKCVEPSSKQIFPFY